MDVVAADRALLNAGIRRAEEAVRTRLAPEPGLRLDAGYGLKTHAELVLERLLERAEHSDGVLARSDDPRDVRVALTGLRRVLHLLRVLHHAVELLRQPAPELGLGSLYFTAELARALVGDQLDLIESPNDAPRYATLSWPYSKLIGGTRTDQDAIPVLLHYPVQEAEAALLIPLLIHELGHPACEARGLVDKVEERLEQDEQWPLVLDELRAAFSTEGAPASLNGVRVALAGPIEELICDALATACLGPSYLLAFAAWAGLASVDEWREQHPPTALRIALIVDQLTEDGWDLGWAGEIVRWARGLSDVFKRDPDPDQPRSDAMRIAAPHIRTVVASELSAPSPRLLPSAYAHQVEGGLEDLYDQDILPAQLDRGNRSGP